VLINIAGENLPKYLWSQMVDDGQDALAFGAIRAAREEGSFSYRNARISEIDGDIAGMLLSYRLPDPYEIDDLASYPVVVQPLAELESRAPDSWYINAIATYEQCRGRGVATALLSESERLAREAGATTMSLIVASENQHAAGIYQRRSYSKIASLPLISYPGGPEGGEWVLMTKHIR
jgi:ribosomal protein S18 acetylase RimI-like enzyme